MYQDNFEKKIKKTKSDSYSRIKNKRMLKNLSHYDYLDMDDEEENMYDDYVENMEYEETKLKRRKNV